MAVNTGKYNRNNASRMTTTTTKKKSGGNALKTAGSVLNTLFSLSAPGMAFNLGRSLVGGNKKSTSKKKKTKVSGTLKNYDLDSLGQSLVDNAGGGYSSGGGGGVSAGSGIDLTNILGTYKDSASAQKKSLSDSYGSQRQQLLDSLKRFQNDTAESRKRQQQAFNSSRADLEEQAYMSNRNAAQSAAARGLGGSGLQQLAQLQSQLSSNKETSNLANENQQAQDTLTRALKEQEDTITKQVNSLSQEEANKLKEIDANTANLMAQLQYQEAVRQQEAIQAASAANASYASSAGSDADRTKALIDEATSTFEGILNSAEKNISGYANSSYSKNKKEDKAARKKAIQKAYKDATNDLSSAYGLTGLPKQYLLAYQQQLDGLYNKYYK